MLGSERMRALKAQLEKEADVVIYDSPPCLALTDAAILTRLVDGTVLVIDSGKTRREVAARAKETLVNVGGRILGVVLNHVQPRSGYYYYYHYYSHDGQRTKKRPAQAPAAKASRLPGWIKR